MGLLSNLTEQEQQGFISALDALQLVANGTNDTVQTVAAFLLNNDFGNYCITFSKLDIDNMIVHEKFQGTYEETWEVLTYFYKATPDQPHNNKYKEKYWLKTDLFSFLNFYGLDNVPSFFNYINENPNQQPQTDSHLSQQLQATIDRQAKQIAELEAQIAEQQKTIEQLTEQAAVPADDDPLFDDLDKRTQSNFVRLFIALNELANAKKGGIRLDKSYNKEHNALINAELDRLGYSKIGEAAYKTLIDLIREKRQKGL